MGEKWQIADGIPPFVRARDVPDAGRLLLFFFLPSSFLSSLSCWSDDARAVVKREPALLGALFFFGCFFRLRIILVCLCTGLLLDDDHGNVIGWLRSRRIRLFLFGRRRCDPGLDSMYFFLKHVCIFFVAEPPAKKARVAEDAASSGESDEELLYQQWSSRSVDYHSQRCVVDCQGGFPFLCRRSVLLTE